MWHKVDFHALLSVNHGGVVEIEFIECGADVRQWAYEAVLHEFDIVLENINFTESVVHKLFDILWVKRFVKSHMLLCLNVFFVCAWTFSVIFGTELFIQGNGENLLVGHI